jgi:SPX domain protein involved in polyphosphate accumulation
MQFKRHELKYYLNPIQTESLARKLGYLLDHDSHSNNDGEYVVRSLYFDSPDDECLFQKQSGFKQRSKIRLRTYGTGSTDTVKFEIKHKHEQMVLKESVGIPGDIALRISNGEHHLLLNMNKPLLDRIYASFATKAYSPKVIVEYTRQAFIHPELNIRITLDKNLRSNISSTDLFSTMPSSTPVILEGKQILEVKYDHYIPKHLKMILSGTNTERSAISKYTLARRFQKLRKWEDN